MKRIFTILLCYLVSVSAFSQWAPTKMQGTSLRLNQSSMVKNYYSLDLNAMRNQLSNAQEMGKGAPVIINIPTLDGKIEKFAVYSNPVVVPELAEKYQLGSYAGVSVDDPEKFIRFSISPFDFKSMIFKNGETQFIDPQNKERTIYAVLPKSNKTRTADGTPWICSTNESVADKMNMNRMLSSGQTLANIQGDFNKSSDKKYRTLRLAMSVNGEYTQYFRRSTGGENAKLVSIQL
jgi:hypothetical protein